LRISTARQVEPIFDRLQKRAFGQRRRLLHQKADGLAGVAVPNDFAVDGIGRLCRYRHEL
jgi:hypothetical protein